MMTSTKIHHDLFNSDKAETQDAYTRRLVTEAKLWSSYAKRNSSLGATKVHSMTLEATAFCLRHHTKSIAIPTKLVGTKSLQDELELLVTTQATSWHKLELVPSRGRIEAYYEGMLLGWLWSGHVWVWPLLTVGIEARLIAVTGTDADWKWLGCNVVLTEVVRAIDAVTLRVSSSETSAIDHLSRVSG